MRNDQVGKKVIALAMVGVLATSVVPYNASASKLPKDFIQTADELPSPSDENVRDEIMNQTSEQSSETVR